MFNNWFASDRRGPWVGPLALLFWCSSCVEDQSRFGAVDESSAALNRPPAEILPSLSVELVCGIDGCQTHVREVQTLRPGVTPDDWDPFENTRMQNERRAEFREQTEEVVASLDARCAETSEGWDVDEDGWPIDEARVTVFLEEEPFDFYRLRGSRNRRGAESLEALKEERTNQLAPSQEAIVAAIEALGGTVIGRLRLVNAIHAAVPTCSVRELASLPTVVGLNLVEPNGEKPTGVDGRGRRWGVGLPSGNYLGLNGGQGSWRSSSDRVRFGVIETTSLNTSHLSFRDGIGSGSRIVDTDRCAYWFPTYYRCINSATTTAGTHGTGVTHAIIGDLTQGQDPQIGDTTERQIRSGIAREAEVHYYSSADQFATSVAIDEATLDNGIDIINLSLNPSGLVHCTMSSHNTVREEIEAATSAGILVVVSAGNSADPQCFTQSPPSGYDTACTVGDYAYYPDSLAVGGSNDAASLTALESVSRNLCSGQGGKSVTLNGGRTVTTRPIDLITNFTHDMLAFSGTDGYVTWQGNSFSTPTVAGLAALFVDWAHDRGGWGGLEEDPYAIRTALSWMGDGREDFFGPAELVTTVGPAFGFGNIRFANLDLLGVGGGFALRRINMQPGSDHEWPVGSTATAIQGWKMVALVDRNSYSGAPDLRVELIDKCPPGGGETVILTADRGALKYRLRMSSGMMATHFRGRCLFVRVTVDHASGPFLFYGADGFYTVPRINHDASVSP